MFAAFDSREKCDQLFAYINNLDHNLKFTVEYPQGTLPFLDVEVTLHDCFIETWVYRESTNTGVLMNFNAVAPVQWKRSLITCLLNRAFIVCSTYVLFHDEVKRLKAIIISNAYPADFFDNVSRRFLQSLGGSQVGAVSETTCSEEPCVYLRVVYVGGPSHNFGKRLGTLICDKYGVEVKVLFPFKVGS